MSVSRTFIPCLISRPFVNILKESPFLAEISFSCFYKGEIQLQDNKVIFHQWRPRTCCRNFCYQRKRNNKTNATHARKFEDVRETHENQSEIYVLHGCFQSDCFGDLTLKNESQELGASWKHTFHFPSSKASSPLQPFTSFSRSPETPVIKGVAEQPQQNTKHPFSGFKSNLCAALEHLRNICAKNPVRTQVSGEIVESVRLIFTWTAII